MISLGIIGEYLARIYEEVKGRPRYLVKESIEPSQISSGKETSDRMLGPQRHDCA
jgi:polyisoprenyl-phosphate glycosyltransferase